MSRSNDKYRQEQEIEAEVLALSDDELNARSQELLGTLDKPWNPVHDIGQAWILAGVGHISVVYDDNSGEWWAGRMNSNPGGDWWFEWPIAIDKDAPRAITRAFIMWMEEVIGDE